MDQASSLSDLLLKSPALSGGLASSTGCAASGDSTKEDLFSAFVSGPDVSALPPLAQHLSAAALPPASLPLPTESPQTVSAASSADALVQSAMNLSTTLQKALAVLQSGSVDVSALSATEQANGLVPALSETQGDAFSPTIDSLTSSEAAQLLSSASSIADNLTKATQIVGKADDSSQLKSFSDVIAELLALMQLVVQTLQQAATGDGAITGMDSATFAVNSLAAPSCDPTEEPLSPPGLLALQPADSSVADSLLDFLKAAAADTKQILDALTQANATDGFLSASSLEKTFDTAALETTAAETTASLTQLEANIKTAIANLKEKIPTLLATKEPLMPSVSAEAAQGTVNPFPKTETTVQASASLPTVVAKTTKFKTTAQEKTKTTVVKTETSSEFKKSEDTSIAADPVLVAALSGAQDNGAFSSESGWSQDYERRPSLSGIQSDLAPAFTADGVQAKGVYGFASTLSAFRAANGGLKGLPSIADQVILHMNRSVKNGESQMSLQLQPSDMGKISVKLDFGADGKVQGTVVADNPKTLEMLQKDSRSLERALQNAGLRAEPGSLEFSLGGGERQNSAGQGTDGTGNGAGNGTISAENENGEIVDIGAFAETYYITPTGVNIRV